MYLILKWPFKNVVMITLFHHDSIMLALIDMDVHSIKKSTFVSTGGLPPAFAKKNKTTEFAKMPETKLFPFQEMLKVQQLLESLSVQQCNQIVDSDYFAKLENIDFECRIYPVVFYATSRSARPHLLSSWFPRSSQTAFRPADNTESKSLQAFH